jgi:hypothetical protein
MLYQQITIWFNATLRQGNFKKEKKKKKKKKKKRKEKKEIDSLHKTETYFFKMAKLAVAKSM